MNASPGAEGNIQTTHREDNYDSIRATGEAAEAAGSGVEGLGGGAGGTPNYAGQGIPGGAHALGSGAAPSRDPQSSGTALSGGLSIPEGAPAGHTPPAHAPGGAGVADPSRATSNAPSQRENMSSDAISENEARAGEVQSRGGATINKPGGDEANANPTQGDEAATLSRQQNGAKAAPIQTPNPGGPMGNTLRPQDAYSPGGPEQSEATGDATPLHDEPTPGSIQQPGPEAQI